jgi:hypothetical protein
MRRFARILVHPWLFLAQLKRADYGLQTPIVSRRSVIMCTSSTKELALSSDGHFEVDFETLSCSFVSYGFARTRAHSSERSWFLRFLGDENSIYDSVGYHSDTIASSLLPDWSRLDRIATVYNRALLNLRVITFPALRSNIDGNFQRDFLNLSVFLYYFYEMYITHIVFFIFNHLFEFNFIN